MKWFSKKSKVRLSGRPGRKKKKSGVIKKTPWMQYVLYGISVLFILSLFGAFLFGGQRLFRFVQSRYFLLKDISISGLHLLDKSDIFQLSGLKYNTNIFRVRLDKTKKNILKHPYVKEVRILKKLPSYLSIQVIERMPFAVLLYNKKHFLLSRDGVVMAKLKNSRLREDLPVISGLEDLRVSVGKKCQGKDIDHCVSVLKEILTSDVSKYLEIRSVEALGDHNITFTTKGNVKLKFKSDSAADVSQGIEKLKAYLGSYAKDISRMEYIDLRFNPISALPK